MIPGGLDIASIFQAGVVDRSAEGATRSDAGERTHQAVPSEPGSV
jgi:hypothetical protein